MDCRKFLEKDDYLVVLDTNCLLELYDYPYDFYIFANECLKTISNFIFLPSTVEIEFNYKHKQKFHNMLNGIKEKKNKFYRSIENLKSNLDSNYMELERFNFSDLDSLAVSINEYIDKISEKVDSYFLSKNNEATEHVYYSSFDEPCQLLQSIKEGKFKSSPISQQQLFSYCKEAEERYSKNLPPGFKDKNKSNGLTKYNDFLIWKEVLNFSKTNKKNIIFVTNDNKSDWKCKNQDTNTFDLLPELISEFENKTNQKIISLSPSELYSHISSSFNLDKNSVVLREIELMKQDVLPKIGEIAYNGIEEEFLSELYNNPWMIYDVEDKAYDPFEIIDYSLIDYELTERMDNNISKLNYTYKISLLFYTYTYICRDDDTKDEIYSPPEEHEINVLLTLCVECDLSNQTLCSTDIISIHKEDE